MQVGSTTKRGAILPVALLLAVLAVVGCEEMAESPTEPVAPPDSPAPPAPPEAPPAPPAPPEAPPEDSHPRFTERSIPNQTYTRRDRIRPLTMPSATGGDGALRYTLTPSVPGLELLERTLTLRGTPTLLGTHLMTYTVTDSDDNNATVDADVIQFYIVIVERENTAAPECLGFTGTKATNSCDETITLFYCYVDHNPGFGSKLCGEQNDANQPYYTHSTNLNVGDSENYGETAKRHIAVCRGRVNPYIEGDFVSSSDGSYGCYPSQAS